MPPPNIEILKRKIRRLTSVPDSFIARMKAVQTGQYSRIITLLRKLDIIGENIDPKSKSNYLLIEKIKQELETELLSGDYADAVSEFKAEFIKQRKLNEDYYNSINAGSFDTVAGDAVVNQIQKQTVKSLIIDSIQKDYLAPLETVLTLAVSSQAGFDETLRYIRLFIEGDEKVDGSIERYAKTITQGSFANADRAYGNAVADELDLEFFLYAGGEIPTTRCFCAERESNYYHWKEIAAWGRGENVGECGFPWQGMNRATNEDTIFTYAGGYNCMHTIAGVSIFDVPREVVERNVENGNYSPTEFERKEFSL